MLVPKRCCVCAQFLPAAQQARPDAKTCGAPACRKENARRVSATPEYKPPSVGAFDHADPNFKPRLRPCGKCQRPFETSAKYRYFCGLCRVAAARQHTQVRAYSTSS